MRIQSIALENFRNLATQTIDLNTQFNLIVGQNASGKTSFLEALYFLSHLKSFRAQDVNRLILTDHEYYRLIAKTHSTNESLHIGLERSKHALTVRINSEDLERRSLLAKKLPMLFLGPDTGQLLIESPRFRRRFLDWGLFHNEPSYHHLWQQYERALKQRNAALKSQLSDAVLESIEVLLSEYGEQLSAFRQAFADELFTASTPLLNRLIEKDLDWSLNYHKGFSGDALREELRQTRTRDRIMGYTRIGPHRADFVLKADGHEVGQFLSRGQIKLASIALMLAQIHLHQDKIHGSTILLMDDMTAELDRNHRAFLLEEFLQLEAQLFITCLEHDEFPEIAELEDKNGVNRYEITTGLLKKVI